MNAPDTAPTGVWTRWRGLTDGERGVLEAADVWDKTAGDSGEDWYRACARLERAVNVWRKEKPDAAGRPRDGE